MSLLGIHHLTAVCSNATRTVDFYTRILGLRLVKKTVNFDDPGAYHLYFGDETGKPGTLITFFEWSNLPKGHWGIGTTHHLAFVVDTQEAQLKWKRRLIDLGVGVTGPYDRNYFHSIYFTDPDGLILEIATRGPGWTVDEYGDQLGTQQINPPIALTRFGRNEEEIARTMWAEPVEAVTPEMKLGGLHHITAMSSNIDRTAEFYTETLGMRLLKRTVNYDDPTAPHSYFGIGEGNPGTIITYFGYTPEKMRDGAIGTGMTHHFAFAVDNEEMQLEWRAKLLQADVQVTPVLDRVYFKSIYFQDPDGHILEIATLGPGFLIDEPPETLGKGLQLPQWLERNRREIEGNLAPIA
jgi:glyoxalase family protein